MSKIGYSVLSSWKPRRQFLIYTTLQDLFYLFCFQIPVPRQGVGIVIGKGGEMIKKIQSETGAKVQFKQGQFTIIYRRDGRLLKK